MNSHDTQSVHEQGYEHFRDAQYFRDKYEARKNNLTQRAERIRSEILPAKREQAAARASQYRTKYGHEPARGQFEGTVVSYEHALDTIEQQLEFLRPSSEEDMQYRLHVMNDLPAAIQDATPDGLPLRFHGTHIYHARSILQSQGASSSVDRLGIATSYDTADQVSVTAPDTFETTINGYSGLLEEEGCVPAGCVFVMLPSSQEEAKAGDSMLMNNVNFKEQPERLFAIMTSDENVPNVREWAAAAGVGEQKVVEFFEFPSRLDAVRRDIEAGHVTLQQYVPYQLS